MSSFVKGILCCILFVNSFYSKSQEKIKTTTFNYSVVTPDLKARFVLKCVISKDFALLNMTSVPSESGQNNTILKQDSLLETSDTKQTFPKMSFTRYPTTTLINRTTGEVWAMWEHENGKVAVKQKDLKPEYVSDSTSNYVLEYKDEYKIIGKFRCQNVKITNKTTNEVSYSYVTKIPEGTFCKMPYETGIKDVIVQSYGQKNASSLSLVSIINGLTSADLFKFSKDVNVFNTSADYSKWQRAYIESIQKQQNN
ncbi:hypothetical protein [Pedobacter frigoris]|uniref:hypothetical protein n=1 Tax=Pedobacter frigoris TaxID=2571272 RepID=UPI00292DB7FD|nr:hypothetical protein [Pedobacter frigoris]